jgi:hypothetical protein
MKLFIVFCLWFTGISFMPVSRDMSFCAIACYAIIATAMSCAVKGAQIRQRRGGGR